MAGRKIEFADQEAFDSHVARIVRVALQNERAERVATSVTTTTTQLPHNFTKLNERNWIEYERNLKAFLCTNDLLLYVIPQRDAAGNVVQHVGWNQNTATKALGHLIMSCSVTTQHHLDGIQSAAEGFEILRNNYESRVGSKMILLSQLMDAKMDDDDIIKHSAIMQNYWSQLKRVSPTMPDDILCFCMLKSISSRFSVVHQTLCTRQALTFQEIVDSILMAKSVSGKSKGSSGATSPSEIAMYGQHNKKKNKKNDQNLQPKSSSSHEKSVNKDFLICTYCGIPRHSIENCNKKRRDDKQKSSQKESKSQNANYVVHTAMMAHMNLSNKCDICSDDLVSDEESDSSWNSNRDDTSITSDDTCNTDVVNLNVDSGSSAIILPDWINVTNREPAKGSIRIANASTTPITEQGSLSGQIDGIPISFNKCMIAPGIAKPLLSVSQVARDGSLFLFFNDQGWIYPAGSHPIIIDRAGTSKMKMQLKDGIYKLRLQLDNNNVVDCNYAKREGTMHERLGHAHEGILRMMGFNENARGCEICSLGKITIKPHLKRPEKSSLRPNRALAADISGPTKYNGLNAERFISVIVDYGSGFVHVRPVEHKGEAVEHIKETINRWSNQLGVTPDFLQSDRGGEYRADALKAYFIEKGIAHHLATVDSPQSTGRAERMNRTLVEKARCMMIQSGISNQFWPYAVRTAAYIINRLPASRRQRKSPYEKMFNKAPVISHLRVWGCLVIIRIDYPKKNCGKFEAKGTRGVFLGYGLTDNHYVVFDSVVNNIRIVRDVEFFEQTPGSVVFKDRVNKYDPFFPFDSYHDIISTTMIDSAPQIAAESLITLHPTIEATSDVNTSVLSPDHNNNTNIRSPVELINQITNTEFSTSIPLSTQSITPRQNVTSDVVVPLERNPQESSPTLTTPSLTTPSFMSETSSTRTRTSAVPVDPLPLTRQSRVNRANNYQNVLNRVRGRSNHHAHLAVIDVEPNSVKEALQYEQWRESINSELKSMKDQGVYELVPRPSDVNVVKSRFVFKTKTNEFGVAVRNKTRLVAQGFSQIPDVDFFDTFASVVRISSVRLLFSLAVLHDFFIVHFDISVAFLNAPLEECVYLEQPPLHKDPLYPDHVWLLRKAIYGLHQSPNAWNTHFSSHFLNQGFSQLHSDYGIFCKISKNNKKIIIAVFVDDFLVFCDCLDLINDIYRELDKSFSVTNLGTVRHFLGMFIQYDKDNKSLFFNQYAYINQILDKFRMNDCNPASSPMIPNQSLSHEEIDTSIPYRSAIGCLTFLSTFTRPDISFAVNKLAQYNNSYNKIHWACVKRIFQYLRATASFGIQFRGGMSTSRSLRGLSDSNWSGDENEECRSTSGFIFLLSGGPITWMSRRQDTVATSSTYAEYVALSECAKEAKWIITLLQELNLYEDDLQPVLECDSKPALETAKRPVLHSKMKHLDIKHHLIREYVKNNLLTLQRIPTSENHADALTKALPLPKFVYHQKVIVCAPPDESKSS